MVFKIFFWIIYSFELWKFSNQRIVSKKFTQKDFLLSTFIEKGLQKFIISLPNWIQILTSIHFPSLCYYQGISIPRVILEISSYPSIDLPLFLFGLLRLPKCYSSLVKVIP
jgi:hypothetical protein